MRLLKLIGKDRALFFDGKSYITQEIRVEEASGDPVQQWVISADGRRFPLYKGGADRASYLGKSRIQIMLDPQKEYTEAELNELGFILFRPDWDSNIIHKIGAKFLIKTGDGFFAYFSNESASMKGLFKLIQPITDDIEKALRAEYEYWMRTGVNAY